MVAHIRMIHETPVRHRLFLALMPPPALAAQIGALRDGLSPRKHVADTRLHMTMGLLDDQDVFDEHIAAAAKRALDSVRSAPVQICLDRISTNPKTSCLIPSERAPALITLQRRIAQAFVDAELPFAAHWWFSPHVTLLYDPPQIRNDPIMPISWRADELALVHSLIGLTRHIVLHRVRLDG